MKAIRFLSLLLALLMLVSLVACKDDPADNTDPNTDPEAGTTPTDPTEEPSNSLAATGAIGDGPLTWELYKDGTLYIKGQGSMADFITGAEEGKSQQPWYSYIGNASSVTVKKVVVEDGVTALSELAFKNCINLQRAELGAGIKDIPRECFVNCSSLQYVVAKNAVTVQDVAFQNCVALKRVTLSASLQTVWDGAFHNAATQSADFAVRLAGTQAEWEAAKAAMDASESDELAIWGGNDALLGALEAPIFVEK